MGGWMGLLKDEGNQRLVWSGFQPLLFTPSLYPSSSLLLGGQRLALLTGSACSLAVSLHRVPSPQWRPPAAATLQTPSLLFPPSSLGSRIWGWPGWAPSLTCSASLSLSTSFWSALHALQGDLGWLGCASHWVGKSKSREADKPFPLQS